MQAHSDELVRRQQVLADAWQALAAKDVADDQWEDAWNEARRAALTEAGFTPVF